MKKVLCVILSLCCALFVFAGCNEQPKEKTLADMEIGDELTVYPNYQFNYKLNYEGEDYIFHIESAKATLLEKNEIKENETLTEPYHPYVIGVEVTGSTDKKLAGTNIRIFYKYTDFNDVGGVITLTNAVVNANGTFAGYLEVPAVCDAANISFLEINIY